MMAASTSTTPVLTGLSIPSVVDVSDGPVNVNFSLSATDVYGIKSALVTLYSPSNGFKDLHFDDASQFQASGTDTVNLTFSASPVGAPYRVGAIEITDNAGNKVRYLDSGGYNGTLSVIDQPKLMFTTADGGRVVQTYDYSFYGHEFGATKYLAAVTEYAADGHELYNNVYTPLSDYFTSTTIAVLTEQDGFDSQGRKSMEIDTPVGGGFAVKGFTAGVLSYANHYDGGGRLYEQEGFDASGGKTIEYDFNADGSHNLGSFVGGVIAKQTGFAADGHLGFVNSYDATGRLYEQDAFDAAGNRTAEVATSADSSRTVYQFTAGVITSEKGYAFDGHETYANVYDATGVLLEQDGFNASGTKIVEYDHLAGSVLAVSQFDGSGRVTGNTQYNAAYDVLSTLTRTPSTGAYTLTGQVGGVTLGAIVGTGSIDIGGGGTTVGLPTQFGSAVVHGFVASGAGQDFIHVATGLAADYAHLMADAHDSGADVVIAFDPHDTLTLQGVHQAQLSAGDFLFG